MAHKSSDAGLGNSDILYPTQNAVKTYVDNLTTGIVWHQPVQIVNVIADADTPVTSPSNLDCYIINNGANTGVWSDFSPGDLIQYQTDKWVFIKSLQTGDRFGISFKSSTSPYGSMTGRNDYVATITGGVSGAFTYSFDAPNNNDALFVSNQNAYFHDVSFTYSSHLNAWVQLSASIGYSFGSGVNVNGTHLSLGDLTQDWNQTGGYNIVLNDSQAGLKMLENGSSPSYFGIFDVADLTSSDKTYTFPDANGTVITTGNTSDINDLTTSNFATNTISQWINDAGYISSFTELDPIYLSSSWSTTTNNSTNWNTAFSWGNHASAGYLTSSLASTTYAKLSGSIFTGAIQASNFSGTSTGVNTGDQTLASLGAVSATTTVNGHSLSSNITITASDVGLSNVPNLTFSGSNTGDVTLVNNTNGLTISNQALTMALAGTSATGTLSSYDWNTFNNKQNALTGGVAKQLTYWTSSSTIASLATGTNGTFLRASSTSASGFEWATIATGVSDANYGDVTVSSSGTVWSINGNSVDLGTDTVGNFVAGATVNGGLTMTGTEAGTLGVLLTSSGTTGLTSSNSGLEVGSNGLTLLKGCTDNYILKYTDAGGWACAQDNATGGITANSLDFTDLKDALTLDATTTISFGNTNYGLVFTNNSSGNEVHNLTSTGDFIISKNLVEKFVVADSGYISIGTTTQNGVLTIQGSATLNNSLSVLSSLGVSNFSVLNSGTTKFKEISFVPLNNYSFSIGTDAGGTLNTTDFYNSFIGYLAGVDSSSSPYSNYIGLNAGNNASNSYNSNFIGSNSGSNASSSYYSNFIGQSISLVVNGYDSNFIGESAGSQSVDSYFSNFIGLRAGYNQASSSYSNFIGHQAGRNANNSFNSNFIGYDAGRLSNNANNSTFIGTNAGSFPSGVLSNSIFIGTRAGYTDAVDNTTTGYYSIAIGPYSGTGGFSNSIALGRGVRNSATQQFNVGNLLYANGLYNSNTGTSTPVSGGKIGIGTSTPSSALTVVGDINYTGSLYNNGSLFTPTITADSLDFTEFKDTLTLDATTTIDFGSTNSGLVFTNNGSGNEVHNMTGTGSEIHNTENGNEIHNLNANGQFLIQRLGSPVFTATPDKRIGIGTSTPLATLDIVGSSQVTPHVISASGLMDSLINVSIQNKSTNSYAQSGFMSIADNGNDSNLNYAWFGINGSGFSRPSLYAAGGANDVNLVGVGNDMYIANSNTTKDIIFSTGNASPAALEERMRLKNDGTLSFSGQKGGYINNTGIINIANTAAFRGVSGESGAGIKIKPALTITEPPTGTFTYYGQVIDMSQIALTPASATVSEISGLQIIGGSDADIDIIKGVDIANLTPTASSETALNIGSGWDNDIKFNDTDTIIKLGATDNTTNLDIMDSNATPQSLFNLKDYATNVGGVATAGAFVNNLSMFSEEFSVNKNTTAVTADTVTGLGDSTGFTYDTFTGTATTFTTPVSIINGVGRFTFPATSGTGYVFALGRTVAAYNGIYLKSNLPIMQAKVRPSSNVVTEDYRIGFLATTVTSSGTNDANPTDGIYFSPENGTSWVGVVRSGGANVGTAVCTGSISTTQFATLRIQVESATAVSFWVDNDASDGVQLVKCGSTVSGANPTAALTVGLMQTHTVAAASTFDVDYIRTWQDDSKDEFKNIALANNALTLDSTPTFNSKTVLADMMTASENLQFNAGDKLDAHVIYANKGVVTPEIAVNKVYANLISNSKDDNDINIAVNGEGKIIFGRQDSESSVVPSITFDTLGNAIFNGNIKAKGIDTENINVYKEQIASINGLIVELKDGINSNSLELTTKINSLNDEIKLLQNSASVITNILSVKNNGGLKENLQGLTVDVVGSDNGIVTFLNDTEFFGTPYLNKDTAGFAVIKTGAKEVRVVFEKPYLVKPIVNSSISMEDDIGVDKIFTEGINFVITNKSEQGFTIKLNKKAPVDIQFSWTSFAVKNPNVFFSEAVQDNTIHMDTINNIDPVIENIETVSTTTSSSTPDIEPVVETQTEESKPLEDPIIEEVVN